MIQLAKQNVSPSFLLSFSLFFFLLALVCPDYNNYDTKGIAFFQTLLRANQTLPYAVPEARRVVGFDSYCKNNPFLHGWNSTSFDTAAFSLLSSRMSLTATAFSAQARQSSTWDRFNGAPKTQPCEGKINRYPKTGDGGKVLCAIDRLHAPCVIYSLGSHFEFDFELEMVKNTPCEIYSFDCTVDISKAPPLPERIHFRDYCLGEENIDNPRFRSLASIATEYGHKEIVLLKMDIEGFEFDVIESMYQSAMLSKATARLLPSQISFELHYTTGMPKLEKTWGAGLSAGDLMLLWVQLSDMGYAVVSREDNVQCPSCSEFTVVRAFC